MVDGFQIPNIVLAVRIFQRSDVSLMEVCSAVDPTPKEKPGKEAHFGWEPSLPNPVRIRIGSMRILEGIGNIL